MIESKSRRRAKSISSRKKNVKNKTIISHCLWHSKATEKEWVLILCLRWCLSTFFFFWSFRDSAFLSHHNEHKYFIVELIKIRFEKKFVIHQDRANFFFIFRFSMIVDVEIQIFFVLWRFESERICWIHVWIDFTIERVLDLRRNRKIWSHIVFLDLDFWFF
jgi:hypothetical protein